MSSVASPEFGRVRAMLWPIHRGELKKFVPMLLIYAFIVFNYTLLKAAKDALVITAPSSGAEILPFIKVWAILPMALGFTYIFTRLSNKYNREKVFYIMMAIFLGFFALFITVLYPLQNYLHPHGLADKLQAALPNGFNGLISVFRNWTYTLFYVMAELWGTTIMTVLFWGFANEVSTVSDAKRFYAILGVGANIATILSGRMSIFLSDNSQIFTWLYPSNRWGSYMAIMIALVIFFGLLSSGIYYWLNRKVFKTCPRGFHNKPGSKKIKMGLRESFTYLAQSKYLMRIAIIVLTYNLALNMVEIVWKDQVRALYPDPVDFARYMGQVMTAIGITSTIVAVFICGNVVRKCGWTISALVTPLILLVTGTLFFSAIFFKEIGLVTFSTMLGVTPLAFAVLLGSTQNCLSRASKFTFFDTTKEMSFIPLSKECKLKGKSAIDGVGSRLGKSGGSLVHQFLLVLFGSVSLSSPIVAVILFGVVFAWIFAVKSLGRRFEKISEAPGPINLDDDEPEPTPTTLNEQEALS